MTRTWRHKVELLLSAWVGLIERHNLLIILLAVISAAGCIHYTIHHLGMNTNTREMLSPDLEWRQLDTKIDMNFPQYSNNIVAVIEANTPDEAADAARLLHDRLKNESQIFRSIYYPAGSDFFRHSALLYLDIDELQDLADNLAAIQPFLSRLTEDQSLRGLFTMLADALEAIRDGEKVDLAPLLSRIEAAFNALEQNEHYTLSWQALMGGDTDDKNIHREFIVLQPILDYGGLFPAATAMEKIRELAASISLQSGDRLRIRLTGGAALAHEEMQSVTRGTALSSIAAFVLVALLLLIGLRSAWLTLASLIILCTGLIYTACFAAATVGELNLISVAFAVLYIGLGADFAIHFCLSYRDSLLRHQDNHFALHDTVTNTGMALIMCTGATAIGFYAFMPTDYDGVAELGWISGTGMLICLFVTLTLLPALFSRFPLKPEQRLAGQDIRPVITRLRTLPVQHAGKIKVTTVLLCAASLFFISRLEFDHNTLNLQSPENESVQTYLDLLAESDTSPWTSTALVDSQKEVAELTQKLEKLPVVSKVVSLNDFIPGKQEEKLGIIEEMDLLLGSLSITSPLPAPDDDGNLAAVKKFDDALQELIAGGYTDEVYAKVQEIVRRFLTSIEHLNARDRHAILSQLQTSLLSTFPGRLDALLDAMQAETVTAETLPAEIRNRWFNNDLYRLEIYPKDNLVDNHALEEFVRQIKVVSNQVSGSPVVAVEASSAVIKAFQQAFLYALIATFLLLLVLTGRAMDTVLIVTPLLLAALFTGAISVLLNIKLNFANIIALPLLLGMGIDSAIYILHSLRHATTTNDDLLANSSSLAVVLSALTTILSIGNLAFSPHLGTASMGKLLTIGLIMTLICTLIILPSLLPGQLLQPAKKPAPNPARNKPLDAQLAFQLIYPLRNTWITPNHLTCVRLLFGILAAAGFGTGNYFWANAGALCFVISNFLDHTDGELARLTGKVSRTGHYFDLLSDAIVNTILFIGIGIGLMGSSLGIWTLPMGIISGLSVAAIFYMRNEIEKSIGKSNTRQPNIGILEAEDVLYLLPVVSLLELLAPFLALAVIGAPAFAIFCWREYRQIKTRPA